jgi:surface polysaccharide O-acyltransferase-like enzyme
MNQPIAMNTTRKHVVWLDVVRLVAMFTVVCCHVSIRPRACFFPLFSFLPLWLHYNLNPLCVQY